MLSSLVDLQGKGREGRFYNLGPISSVMMILLGHLIIVNYFVNYLSSCGWLSL